MNRKKMIIFCAGFILLAMCIRTMMPQGHTEDADSLADIPLSSQASINSEPGPFGKYESLVTFTKGKLITVESDLPQGDTYEENEYTKYVQNKINAKGKHVWELQWEAHLQKVAVSAASGNLPDAVIVDRNLLKELAEEDAICDLTDLYDQYISPFLKDHYDSYNGRVIKEATVNGKLMGLPGTNISLQHNLLWIRKDWLDKVGLLPPNTLEDVLEIVKAFVEEDPDQNGVDDTVGFVADPRIAGIYGMMYGFDPIFGYFGAFPKQWIKDSAGKIVYGSTLPEMKTALEKMHDMYMNGLIDSKFALRMIDDTNSLITEEKCGICFGPWWSPIWPLVDSVKKNPKADWKPFSAPLDPEGRFNIYSQDPVNSFLVVRKGYRYPEAIIKVLNVQFNGMRCLDPEALEIYKGKGVIVGAWPFNVVIDYEDAVYRIFRQLQEAINMKSNERMRVDYKGYYERYIKNQDAPGVDAASWSTATAFYDGAREASTANLNRIDNVFFGNTPVMQVTWNNLTRLENEMFLKIIIGVIEVDEGFNEYIKEWEKMGGKELTDEINKQVCQ